MKKEKFNSGVLVKSRIGMSMILIGPTLSSCSSVCCTDKFMLNEAGQRYVSTVLKIERIIILSFQLLSDSRPKFSADD